MKLKCNYYKKIGNNILSQGHDEKAVKSFWIGHGNRGLMHVCCCEECAKIVEETDVIYGSSDIVNND